MIFGRTRLLCVVTSLGLTTSALRKSLSLLSEKEKNTIRHMFHFFMEVVLMILTIMVKRTILMTLVWTCILFSLRCLLIYSIITNKEICEKRPLVL